MHRSSSVRVRHAPALSPSSSSLVALHCCCGRVDCLFLRRNCSIFKSVEKDVHTAAQLGQALLARHEAYMADAERDRLDLTSRIERLEMDKLQLEADNAAKVDENRCLVDQLEALNNSISDSDTKIKSLEASLLSSQQTVRRLEAAAARAADAERHMALLEEYDKLHKELRSTRDDVRSHAQRFKEAQRGILDMQDQLERIESEARQERQRHVEVVERMERQREIDKQLDVAAGRLKGAAATKSLHDQRASNRVVGHFVRDLLEDNANLQLGIAELREMLLNSSDEIQSLREQLMYHQPVPSDADAAAHTPGPSLKAELEPLQDDSRLSQELHIHHHYHVTPKPDAKRPRKKRQGMLHGVLTPPASSSPSSPRPAGHWGRLMPSPTAPDLLSRATGASTPTPSPSRNSWGLSSNTPSEFSLSAPSSPQSNHASAVFDAGVADADAMTSPTTSFDPMSPTWRPSHGKKPSVGSSKSFHSLAASLLDSVPNTPSALHQSALPEHSIREEDEDDRASRPGNLPELVVQDAPPTQYTTVEAEDGAMSCPSLRRAPSHESIMSLGGGLDIHTLKSRPGQMTLRRLGGGADVVVTSVTARPTLLGVSDKWSRATLRDHFAGFQTPRSVSGPTSQPQPSPGSSPAPPGGSGGALSLGRWVRWRPWGGGSSLGAASGSPQRTDRERDQEPGRAAGINQPGAIPGFQQYWVTQKRKGTPARVTAETDHEALSEGLQE